MKLETRLLVAAAVISSALAVTAGDVTGKITLKGTPAPEKELPLDPTCGKLHGDTKPKTRFYVVGADGGLADVFVYLKSGDGITGKSFTAPKEPAVIDQQKCEYTPYVSGLQTGQTLLVKNSDPLLHNVHPTPQVAGNPESNKAQMAGAKPFEYTFPKSELPLRFKCDVHPWMFAYVGVLEHPFYAVTAADGTFKIKDVPPGKYTVEAFHRKTHISGGKGLTQEVTVGADGAKADFVVEVK